LVLASFVQLDVTVIYSEPNTNAEVVDVLVCGEVVNILGYDASEGWALVQSDSDLAGWIQAELLGDTAPIIVESVQVAPNTQQQAAPAPQPPAPPAGGDADGGNVVRVQSGRGQRLANAGDRVGEDALRIVLHPARLRIMLRKLALRSGEFAAVAVEQNGAGAAGALVDGQQRGHCSSP
jgi:hypothetical protein